jgi:hypothetical protein
MKIIGVRRRSIRPSAEHYSRPVPGNIAKKFGCEKLTEFLNHKPETGPNLTGKCVGGLEHCEILKRVIKILENDAI